MLTFTRGRVLLAVLAGALVVSGCSDDAPTPTPSVSTATTAASTTKAGSAPASPVPAVTTPGPAATGATGEPAVAVSVAPAVKVGTVAKLRDDVLVTIGRIRKVTVKAEQPGEIAGPAASVVVTVRNASDQAFSLGGMVVTASYNNGTPGDQTTAGPSKPMVGSLAAGKRAEGTYVFRVPRKYFSTLRIEVSSDESPTIVQFDR